MRPRILRHPVYYGWTMLVGVAVAQVVSWGILYYAFAVFQVPMQAELGWSPVALSGAYSLALLCAGLAAVPVGRWLDRHGPRALMSAGSLVATLLLVAWARVESLAGFYLVMAGIGLVSAAVLYEPAFAIIAVWFRRQRGRALTLLTFFGAFASFIFIPLSAWLSELLGWRAALLVLAAILAVITIPIHTLLLRRRPADLGLRPDGDPAAAPGAPAILQTDERSLTARAALAEPRFWLISFAFAASTFAGVTMTVHLIPHLLVIGHGPGFAATVAGLFGLMSLLGRMTIGPLADRHARDRITTGLLLMQALGLLALLAVGASAAGALLYVALFGAASGTLTIMRAALLAEHYGPASYGTINGAQNLDLTGARTAAPVGAGLLAGALGSYTPLLWGLCVLLLLGAAAVSAASRRGSSSPERALR
jgi:MFS family permease